MSKTIEKSPASQQRALRILRESADAVDAHLREFLSRAKSQAPARLLEAIEYSLFAGGKRLRPALVLETARACGADHSQSALAAAAAIELIHTFSLVHDDLPAMDDDDLRRGRATNHKVFGEAMAILAGDAMTTLAFEIISRNAEPDLAAKLVLELSHAAGPCGMIGGQVLDMDGEHQSHSLEHLQHIHRMKTGALLTASCRLGAIAARASESTLENITAFGRHLGLAFQIIDDVLDVTSTPEQLGKHTKKDATHGKNTYPSLMGLEESRAEAARQLDAALQSLRPLGAPAEGLTELAQFVVERHK
jgi:geranylgeranyl diphosphate synthase type II